MISFRAKILKLANKHKGAIYNPPYRPRQTKQVVILAVIAVVIISSWEILPRIGAVDPVFLPPFSEVMPELVSLFATGKILAHLWTSLRRLLMGYLIGSAMGLALAVAAVYKPTMKLAFATFVIGPFSVPKIMFLPVLILWFGIGEITKIILIAAAAFFPVAIASNEGLKDDAEHYRSWIDAAIVEGCRGARLMFQIAVPCAATTIFSGLKTSIAASATMMVTVEMLAASRGLGFLLLNSQQLLLTKQLFAVAIVVGALSILVYNALAAIQRLFLSKE